MASSVGLALFSPGAVLPHPTVSRPSSAVRLPRRWKIPAVRAAVSAQPLVAAAPDDLVTALLSKVLAFTYLKKRNRWNHTAPRVPKKKFKIWISLLRELDFNFIWGFFFFFLNLSASFCLSSWIQIVYVSFDNFCESNFFWGSRNWNCL